MKDTIRSTKEIINDMLSKDPTRIWSGSCDIISLGQNHNRIMEFIPYLDCMKESTKNINLGGLLRPNSRLLNKAFETIEFHKLNKTCPCSLFGENSNPISLQKENDVTIVKTSHLDQSNYVDYYMVRCNQCNQLYKVEERQYHYFWWNWIPQ